MAAHEHRREGEREGFVHQRSDGKVMSTLTNLALTAALGLLVWQFQQMHDQIEVLREHKAITDKEVAVLQTNYSNIMKAVEESQKDTKQLLKMHLRAR